MHTKRTSSILSRGRMTVAVWALAVGVCGAQGVGVATTSATGGVGKAAAKPADTGQIETRADKLDYNRETGWIDAKGHVTVRKGDRDLRADYIRVNVKSEDAYAYGNVTLVQQGQVWKGNELRYNFRSKIGGVSKATFTGDPFRLTANKTERLANNEYRMQGARITSCTNASEHWHYHVRARSATVVPNDHLTAKGAVFFFGPVPVMYMPYWRRNLKEDFGFRFYPGYSSRMGAFLLSSYRYRLHPALRGETHVDYRSERGFAYGQDFKWQRLDGFGGGSLSGYYIDDEKPLADDDPLDKDVTNERYRFRLKHAVDFDDRNYAMMDAQYLSDAYMLEDFFEDDYQESREPDNFFNYAHRGDHFDGSVLVEGRLNDFYSSVNRLPEVALDFMRQPMGESSLYYEGRTAAAYLEKTWAKGITNREDNSAFRIDSSHMVYRPSKALGFLTLIPRAGYRGTYYSETRETVETEEFATTTATNVVVDAFGNTNSVVTATTAPRTLSRDLETGADLRSLFELGMETSFKAFRTWEGLAGPRRHIVEPYANYTFVPEPDLLPENLPQFDDVDKLGQNNSVRLGVRNKLQSKHTDGPFDLVDMDVYTTYWIEGEGNTNELGDIVVNTQLKPADWLKVDFDAEYSAKESLLKTFNTQISLYSTNAWELDVEYRFRESESSLLSGELTLKPCRTWIFDLYGRYEMEESRLEETWAYVTRKLDCLAVKFGAGLRPGYTRTDGSPVEDEYRFAIEFWLTAFPDVTLSGKHRQ